MPGDYSRRSLNPTKKYSAVRAMQGRMQLDSDWNEQLELQEHRTGTETRDVIGLCGTPKAGNGFLLTQTPEGADFLIAPGTYYVDGMLCELAPARLVVHAGSTAQQIILPSLWMDGAILKTGQWLQITADQNTTPLITQLSAIDATALSVTLGDSIAPYQGKGTIWASRAITYTTQPFFPTPEFTINSPTNNGEAVQLEDGDYIAFLRAKKREVSALEDPHIREVALGGPDTCAREQIVWQVGLLQTNAVSSPPSSAPDCAQNFPEWDQLVAPMTGQLNARTVPPPANQNPCALPPQAGYQSLDNQLYRVEIFNGGSDLNSTTFVWSRDNATVETNITSVDDQILTVGDLGKDDLHAFAVNQWVEIVDPEGDLNNSPRFLTQISDAPDPGQSTINIADSASVFAGRTDLRLRRWDMSGASVTSQGIPAQAGWLQIENGIQVNFTEGSYSSHAYWQIPARTATGEIEWPPFQIPNLDPIPQPPLGDLWKYCRLALLEVRGGIWVFYDCRAKFPALTNICADDVCYQSSCEDFQSAKTVQQALDEICHERDLRFHNQHLHGWGVVCGLEVVCGPDGPSGPRENVTVKQGYAIDCNGSDLILDQDVPLNLFDMIPSSPPGSAPQDGDYSLILNSDDDNQFTVVPYEPDSLTQSLFNGSILMDFFNDCIKSVTNLFSGAFNTNIGAQTTGNQLVTLGQQRIDTFTDLLAQYIQPDTGSYVYISGFQPNATPPTEDGILREFYSEVKQKLQSETFCAMYDHARPFPDYPFPNLQISSIYGKGFRSNFRVDPTGSRLYAFGADENIYVYNLSTNQIDSIIQFPTSGSVVQDLAFSSNGSQLYAASILNNQETIFAIADVSGFAHTWRTPATIICNILITTLGMLGSDANNVYALGRGFGIYKINIAAPQTTPPFASPSSSFAAFEHMVIDSFSGFAYATSLSGGAIGTAPANFNQVQRINLSSPGTNEVAYPVPAAGTTADAIGIVPSDIVTGGRLFVTSPSGTAGTQQLLAFNGATAAPAALSTLSVGETVNTQLRLAHNPVTQMMMISCLDSNRVRIVAQDGTSTTIPEFAFPTEFMPNDIAYNARANHVFILNQASNTFSVVPPGQFQLSSQIDFNALLTYRSGVIDAFLDLLGGFLQYLKDCFCDHILVKCPTCDGSEVIYLGTISIRDGQINKICNFTKRKYVKSFPTIGYWLSLIPIVPLLHMAVEKFCCAALPDFFAAKSAPQPSAAVAAHPLDAAYQSTVSGLKVQGGYSAVKNFKILDSIQSVSTRLNPSKTIFSNYLLGHTQAPTPPPASVNTAPIIGQSADASKAALQNSKINVTGLVQANSANLPGNLIHLVNTPTSLPPNSSVTLVVDQNNSVVGVVPASTDLQALSSSIAQNQTQLTTATTQIQQLTQANAQLQTQLNTTNQTLAANKTAIDNVSGLTTQVTALQSQLALLQATHASDLSTRDQQIAQLQTNLTQAQGQLKTVTDLQAQVKDLASKIQG